MKPIDYATALAVIVMWGLNFPIVKLGLTELPPLLLMALRSLMVAASLCPFRPLPRDKLRQVLVLSLVFGIGHFALIFIGLSMMDASTAALLSQSAVPFAALLAALFFGDRLGGWRLTGMAIALLGVFLIIGEPRFDTNLLAPLLILGASFSFAVVNVLIKRLGPIDSFALSGWIALFVAPQLLLLSLLLEQGQGAALRSAGRLAFGSMIYSGYVVSIASYVLWYPLVRRHSLNQTMPFNLLTPFVTVLASALLLGEHVTARTAMGGVATMLGVAMIVLRRQSQA